MTMLASAIPHEMQQQGHRHDAALCQMIFVLGSVLLFGRQNPNDGFQLLAKILYHLRVQLHLLCQIARSYTHPAHVVFDSLAKAAGQPVGYPSVLIHELNVLLAGSHRVVPVIDNPLADFPIQDAVIVAVQAHAAFPEREAALINVISRVVGKPYPRRAQLLHSTHPNIPPIRQA